MQTSPYNYDAPGALTPEQRQVCLDGLIGVMLDIYLSLTPEERARRVAHAQSKNNQNRGAWVHDQEGNSNKKG